MFITHTSCTTIYSPILLALVYIVTINDGWESELTIVCTAIRTICANLTTCVLHMALHQPTNVHHFMPSKCLRVGMGWTGLWLLRLMDPHVYRALTATASTATTHKLRRCDTHNATAHEDTFEEGRVVRSDFAPTCTQNVSNPSLPTVVTHFDVTQILPYHGNYSVGTTAVTVTISSSYVCVCVCDCMSQGFLVKWTISSLGLALKCNRWQSWCSPYAVSIVMEVVKHREWSSRTIVLWSAPSGVSWRAVRRRGEGILDGMNSRRRSTQPLYVVCMGRHSHTQTDQHD